MSEAKTRFPRWVWIPFLGMGRAVVEHSAICNAHRRASQRRDYAEMDRLFRLTWPAMNLALISTYIWFAEMVGLLLIGVVIASFL